MAGIAGIVHWDQAPVCRDSITRMLELIRHRGPDGLHAEIRDTVGLGHAHLHLTEREAEEVQPLWLPDGSCCIVADVRLYNRRELIDELRGTAKFMSEPTDAQLVLAAYQRWQLGSIHHLRGDFSFAIWDNHRRRLFAARDPFGVKPFFYAANKQRFCFGSEAKQLVALSGAGCDPNRSALAGLLATTRPRATEETFFNGILRLRAGHCLTTDSKSLAISRWWRPKNSMVSATPFRPQEYSERFYGLFRAAVRKRIDSVASVALELSGGYDSSSILAAAADADPSTSQRRGRIFTVSQHYPGLSCDESDYIASMLAISPFPATSYNVKASNYTRELERELRKPDAPYPDSSWERLQSEVSMLSRENCRVLVTGLGGDELTWDPDYEIDFWRNGRHLQAIRHCLIDRRKAREGARLESLLRLGRYAIPERLQSSIRRMISDKKDSGFSWMTEHALCLASTVARADIELEPDLPSMAQASIYRWLNGPAFQWVVEYEELLAAHSGLELRHPFLDQDLVEFVLSIPWESRCALPGNFKTLLVAALGQRLPAPVRERGDKAAFDDYFEQLEGLGRAAVEKRVFGSDIWLSEDLICRRELESTCSTASRRSGTGLRERKGLWIALMTELWLREVTRTNSD